MNVKIVFTPDGRWNGGGTLPARLKDFGDLSAWIRDFLAEVKDLRKRYLTALGNDGRLLGQEKANIAAELEDVIGALLLFRRHLTEGRPDLFTAPVDTRSPFSVKLMENSWSGYGKLGYVKEIGERAFSELHNELILDRIRELFTFYGKAVADGTITPEESAGLLEKIDDLFGDLMRVERKLLHSDMAW